MTLPTIISLIGQLAGSSRGIAVSFHMFMKQKSPKNIGLLIITLKTVVFMGSDTL
ncbi:hypothetical protein (plasmid) [Metabacillus dongyingensis]|nr:hypothetical protein [Metabacillus dongyingensis]